MRAEGERPVEGVGGAQTLPFATDVGITPPEGLGAAGFVPTGDYDAELDVDGTDYEVVLADDFSQRVGPRDVDRFTIWVGAERSSAHVFAVVLRLVGGDELRSAPVRLDYFMPRSARWDGTSGEFGG